MKLSAQARGISPRVVIAAAILVLDWVQDLQNFFPFFTTAVSFGEGFGMSQIESTHTIEFHESLDTDGSRPDHLKHMTNEPTQTPVG